MANPILRKSLIHITIIVTAVLILAIMGGTAWSSRKQQKKNLTLEERDKLTVEELKVENKTKGLTIIGLEKVPHQVKVTLRNDYSKAITGYKVSIGVATMHKAYLAGIGEPEYFLPGQVNQDIYPLQPGIEIHGIKILAVILDDKTADGDPRYVREIQEYRLGTKMQRKHVLHLLQKALALPSSDLQTYLANIQEADLLPLSEGKEKLLPRQVRSGLGDERERTLQRIKELRQTLEPSIAAKNSQDAELRLQRQFDVLIQAYIISIDRL